MSVYGPTKDISMSWGTISLPAIWETRVDEKEKSVEASFDFDRYDELFSVQVYDTSDSENGVLSCSRDEIFRTYISALEAPDGIAFKAHSRPDGYKEYSASGTMKGAEGSPMWIALRLLCSSQRHVFFAYITQQSRDVANLQLDAIVATIKWARHSEIVPK